MSKYIFITGGVVSSLGKGITAASLGSLLIKRGLRVTVQKLDPYLNVDPGTMSPYQHGEVFVTDDGAETDLDLGHYERFLDSSFTQKSNYTSGKIYQNIITKERAGEYLGSTVQVVPHVTNEIKDAMRSLNTPEHDIVIIEIGGTVGDIEGQVFLEAIRQFKLELGYHNQIHLHVTLLPYLESAGEVKTKPTQHSVKELTSLGLSPDVIVCRSNKDVVVTDEMKAKIALFCNLKDKEYIIHNRDCESIYEVPNILKEQHLDDIVLKKLKLKCKKANINDWNKRVKKLTNDNLKKIHIAIVGKYTSVPDAYISITESLKIAGIDNNVKVKVHIVDSEEIENKGAENILKDYAGIVVAGGFGSRGTEGKIMACNYARTHNIPYLGLCLGMQIAVIEFARSVCNLKDATSTEFDANTNTPIIAEMEEQKHITKKGGTMRLGAYTCKLNTNSLSYKLYGEEIIHERHRHRYEFNNKYKDLLSENGMKFVGTNPKRNLVEIIELPQNNFFIAVQFHPEFKTRFNFAHPLFNGFISASK